MVCGLLGIPNLQGCHIYDKERYNELKTTEEKQQKLIELELLEIDSMVNLLALCKGCHTLFDHQKIGINENFEIIITGSIWNSISNPYTRAKYGTFHGNRICFKHSFQSISRKAVAERFTNCFSPKRTANDMEIQDQSVVDEDEVTRLIKQFDYMDIDEVQRFEEFLSHFMIGTKLIKNCSNKDLIEYIKSNKTKMPLGNVPSYIGYFLIFI